MLDKFLGKKSKYYLELSEEEIAAVPEPPATPAPQTAEQSEAPGETDKGQDKKTGLASLAKDTLKKVSSAKPAKDAGEEETSAEPDPAPAASISDPIELIRTALAAAANRPAEPEPEPTPTFDYTTPVAKASRRRPGPSMSPFKTMAKDMRKTTSGF